MDFNVNCCLQPLRVGPTCGHSQAGGHRVWPQPAQPDKTEPWTHRIDPRIGLAGTSSRHLACTPWPADKHAGGRNQSMARRKKSIHGQARINEITVIKMKQASHAVKTFMNAYKWGLNLERRERGEKSNKCKAHVWSQHQSSFQFKPIGWILLIKDSVMQLGGILLQIYQRCRKASVFDS